MVGKVLSIAARLVCARLLCARPVFAPFVFAPFLSALFVFTLFVFGGSARAADLIVRGCDRILPGEVGMGQLVADIGDTVGVAVTVDTVNDVQAFGLEIAFPAKLLRYVRTDPGELTGGWTATIGPGPPVAARSLVRVGGFGGTPIPVGTAGRLATLFFVVTGAGTDSFTTVALVDDLAGYTACGSVHTPTHVQRETWGRVKALYEN